MNDYTGLLYARPSALDGIGGLLDLTDTMREYNTSETPEEADYEAIHSDWNAVGQDIREATSRYAGEHDG